MHLEGDFRGATMSNRGAQLRMQAKLTRRLAAANAGSYAPRLSDDALRDRLAEADDMSARLLGAVEQLSAEQPQFASVLSNIVQATLSRG